jgi:hypothetical protein
LIATEHLEVIGVRYSTTLLPTRGVAARATPTIASIQPTGKTATAKASKMLALERRPILADDDGLAAAW